MDKRSAKQLAHSAMWRVAGYTVGVTVISNEEIGPSSRCQASNDWLKDSYCCGHLCKQQTSTRCHLQRALIQLRRLDIQ
jgi:hypothetical protein